MVGVLNWRLYSTGCNIYIFLLYVELADALADPIRYISNLEKHEEMLKALSDETDISFTENDSQRKVN